MNKNLEIALEQMPENLAQPLKAMITDTNYDATLSADQFNQLLTSSGLSDKELRLALLPVAASYANVPLSDFYVGAIARGLSGRLYFGANVELDEVQLGQTVHAEQAAISHAWMKGEQGLKDVTINFSPCGHCRQFMNELNGAENLKIQLPDREEKGLYDYLPEAFGPSDLGIEEALMRPKAKQPELHSDSSLMQSALDALMISHSPYTKNPSGVALQLRDGSVYKGAYAENAAYNPSLPPLQVALVQVRLSGKSFSDITHAALVETNGSKMSHLIDTQGTLEAINPDIELEYQQVG
ncbi:cytidine deaminase [Vibrio sp. SCSIO 43136]|uniref:cytidine deaminase n=1 Tax=Vibrio sp. SCSIO 43136 TaxID=2819101 RepID=UPI0020750131|nr:cytidine deaminase [Vibrio sp. SCSIO 43136]USD64001.1 cytidine deaminase [Vibrio sp. SCSIO 43136]